MRPRGARQRHGADADLKCKVHSQDSELRCHRAGRCLCAGWVMNCKVHKLDTKLLHCGNALTGPLVPKGKCKVHKPDTQMRFRRPAFPQVPRIGAAIMTRSRRDHGTRYSRLCRAACRFAGGLFCRQRSGGVTPSTVTPVVVKCVDAPRFAI